MAAKKFKMAAECIANKYYLQNDTYFDTCPRTKVVVHNIWYLHAKFQNISYINNRVMII